MHVTMNMTKDEAKGVLREAFSKLDDEKRANLRWHAQKRTPIHCKSTAWAYYGAGRA